MEFIKHPACNMSFGKPVGWDDEKHGSCGSLPVHAYQGMGGIPVLASYWKPSAQDLEVLVAGGVVVLSVYGGGHPPVSMHVEHMTTEIDGVES